MSRLGERWVKTLARALHGEEPACLSCPRCGSTGLEVRAHVLVRDSGGGFCVVRCATCANGLWMSVTPVPERFVADDEPVYWPSAVFD